MISIHSLAFKISVGILTAILVIFTAILLYNYTISRSLLIKNVEENVKNLAESRALQIEKLIESSARVPLNIASVLESTGYDIEDLKTYLELMVSRNDEIFGSCIAFEPYAFDPDSFYYAPYVYKGTDGLVFKYLNSREMNYPHQSWYSVPAETKKPYWTEPYFDEGGGNILMCTYSVPFFDPDDPAKLKGIVTIDLSLKWLKDYVEKIKAYKNSYAFLISSKGTFITHALNETGIEQNVFDLAEERDYDVLRKAAVDMVNGGRNFIEYDTPIIKGKTWLYYTPLEFSGWSLSLIIPEEDFMSDLQTLNRDLLLIGIIGIVLILVIVVYISGRITRPLTVLADVAGEFGKGNFDVKLPDSKSMDEIGRLNSSVKKMQAELKNYIINLQETTAAKEKIESELQIARDIQQGIIPKIFPPFPDRDNLDLYAVLEPARDVGGDLYDFFFVDERHLCFAIGDVSGKGVPASLFMAITRTLLRSQMDMELKVNGVLKEMNEELCMENENAMFVTLFLGALDVETGMLNYCNAGHNYPLIRKEDGTVISLNQTHGPPLGAIGDMNFGETKVQLDRGDYILLYTDGVSEAIDKNENQYSEGRLHRKLEKASQQKAKVITKEIIADLEEFVGDAEQFDDITMLVIGWNH